MRRSTPVVFRSAIFLGILACGADPVAPTVVDDLTVNGLASRLIDGKYTIASAGTYTLAGSVHDGMVEVNATGRVELVLQGVDITHAGGPAILFTAASEAVITLAQGTVNELSDGTSNTVNAVLYSKPSLTIRGEGGLVVTGNRLEGITTEQHFTMEGGALRVVAVEDGVNASNDSEDPGDDSIITISGGSLYILAGGDGIDSNGTIVVTGGTIISVGSSTNEGEGLDCKIDVTIQGGTIVSTGDVNKCPLAGASQQRALLVSVAQLADTLVCVEDLLAFVPPRSFDKLFFSSPGVEAGVTYTVVSGGSASGVATDGLYPAGTVCAGGTAIGTVDTTSTDVP